MKVQIYTMDRCARHSFVKWLEGNHQEEVDWHVKVNRDPWLDEKTNHTGDGVIRAMLVRDPYNWTASWMQAMSNAGLERDIAPNLEEFFHAWQKQAESFVDVYNPFVTHNVQMNGWHMCGKYRRFVADLFGMTDFCDKHAQEIHGPGSAFDGLAFNGRAGQMPVLTRWQNLCENKLFIDFLKDHRQANELCGDIFGQRNPLKSPEKWYKDWLKH